MKIWTIRKNVFALGTLGEKAIAVAGKAGPGHYYGVRGRKPTITDAARQLARVPRALTEKLNELTAN